MVIRKCIFVAKGLGSPAKGCGRTMMPATPPALTVNLRKCFLAATTLVAGICLLSATPAFAGDRWFKVVDNNNPSRVAFFVCQSSPKEKSLAWFKQNCNQTTAAAARGHEIELLSYSFGSTQL
jgi:hypothetical protein